MIATAVDATGAGRLGVAVAEASAPEEPSLPATAQPADLFDEIYRRGAPIESTLKTVSASFVETTTSTLLKAPQVARGTLVARRPSDVRLQYSGADARTVVISGNIEGGSLTDSNPASLLSSLAVYCVALLYLLRQPRLAAGAIGRNMLLLAMFLLPLVSSFWSDDPILTARRAIALARGKVVASSSRKAGSDEKNLNPPGTRTATPTTSRTA